jgi:hypothetical protein
VVQQQWTVTEGPDFAKSLDACGIARDRLNLHVDSFKMALSWDPFLYSTPFDGESRVAIQTNDYVGDGCVLTAYVYLYEGCKAEIKWIEPSSAQSDEIAVEMELEAASGSGSDLRES